VSEPSVTVGMPVRNCGPSITKAIRSVLSQTYRNWTLFVVDDGSTDDTVQRAESFQDDRIQVLKDGESMGTAARRNQAVALGHGKYFAWLDGDDISYPERLARQVALLESTPELDVVGASMLVFGDNGEALGWRPCPETHEQICVRPRSGFYLAQGTWCGHQRWFAENRYDTRAIRCEDYDLLLRTWRNSRFGNVPEILYGCYEDSVALEKILRGRRYSIASVARETGGWVKVETARAAIEQGSKAVVDIIAVGLGIESMLLRHRRIPLGKTERARWQELWVASGGS
jgi:glycosyltransferase involved in cell wall biosynthesis